MASKKKIQSSCARSKVLAMMWLVGDMKLYACLIGGNGKREIVC